MAKVSVIVPVYNVEKYLKTCLDSLVGQTFSDIEIILIDDKSSDNSVEICERYARDDERIVLIKHELNIGTNGAVMSGVGATTGEFIMFCDSDDWVEPDYVEVHYNEIIESKADCVSSGWKTMVDGEVEFHFLLETTRCFNKTEIEEEILIPFYEINGYYHDVFGNSRVSKIYKTKLLLEVVRDLNPQLLMGEDTELNLRVLHFCESVKTLRDYQGYNYRRDNTGSTTRRFDMKIVEQEELKLSEIVKFAHKQGREAKAFSNQYVCGNYRFKGVIHLLTGAFLSDLNFDEKVEISNRLFKLATIQERIEHLADEIYVYLEAKIDDKQKYQMIMGAVNILEQQQASIKDYNFNMIISMLIDGNISNNMKIKLIREIRHKFSNKKSILNLAKTQSFKGKVSYILIYLGFEGVVIRLVEVLKNKQRN